MTLAARRRARCVPDGFLVTRPSSMAACLLSASAMACWRSLLPCRHTIAAREVKRRRRSAWLLVTRARARSGGRRPRPSCPARRIAQGQAHRPGRARLALGYGLHSLADRACAMTVIDLIAGSSRREDQFNDLHWSVRGPQKSSESGSVRYVDTSVPAELTSSPGLRDHRRTRKRERPEGAMRTNNSRQHQPHSREWTRRRALGIGGASAVALVAAAAGPAASASAATAGDDDDSGQFSGDTLRALTSIIISGMGAANVPAWQWASGYPARGSW